MYSNRELIILASASPRRQQYLQEMGLKFSVQTASVIEEPVENEDPDTFVLRMAKEKAAVVSSDSPDSWVISGDTVVCLGRKILGKPVNETHAVSLLMELAGREHVVKTAFCVCRKVDNVSVAKVVTTRVSFADFTEAVAVAYVATGEPLDKAGAYGIQGKGAVLVKSIDGSYSNVVGLPLHELVEVLLEYEAIELSL